MNPRGIMLAITRRREFLRGDGSDENDDRSPVDDELASAYEPP